MEIPKKYKYIYNSKYSSTKLLHVRVVQLIIWNIEYNCLLPLLLWQHVIMGKRRIFHYEAGFPKINFFHKPEGSFLSSTHRSQTYSLLLTIRCEHSARTAGGAAVSAAMSRAEARRRRRAAPPIRMLYISPAAWRRVCICRPGSRNAPACALAVPHSAARGGRAFHTVPEGERATSRARCAAPGGKQNW